MAGTRTSGQGTEIAPPERGCRRFLRRPPEERTWPSTGRHGWHGCGPWSALSIAIGVLSWASTATAAGTFGYRKAIVFNGVSGTHLSFPVLVSLVDADLQARVASASGYDIVFRGEDSTTCGGPATCTLDHEIERWDGTTGTLAGLGPGALALRRHHDLHVLREQAGHLLDGDAPRGLGPELRRGLAPPGVGQRQRQRVPRQLEVRQSRPGGAGRIRGHSHSRGQREDRPRAALRQRGRPVRPHRRRRRRNPAHHQQPDHARGVGEAQHHDQRHARHAAGDGHPLRDPQRQGVLRRLQTGVLGQRRLVRRWDHRALPRLQPSGCDRRPHDPVDGAPGAQPVASRRRHVRRHHDEGLRRRRQPGIAREDRQHLSHGRGRVDLDRPHRPAREPELERPVRRRPRRAAHLAGGALGDLDRDAVQQPELPGDVLRRRGRGGRHLLAGHPRRQLPLDRHQRLLDGHGLGRARRDHRDLRRRQPARECRRGGRPDLHRSPGRASLRPLARLGHSADSPGPRPLRPHRPDLHDHARLHLPGGLGDGPAGGPRRGEPAGDRGGLQRRSPSRPSRSTARRPTPPAT